jgi:hypothetical protein
MLALKQELKARAKDGGLPPAKLAAVQLLPA